MAVPLGLGLVGAGGFGQFCLGAYAELAEVQIVAVADIDQERARAVAPSGSRAYSQYSTLLTDSEVEIVAINTPPFLHGPMIREAAAGTAQADSGSLESTDLVEAVVESSQHPVPITNHRANTIQPAIQQSQLRIASRINATEVPLTHWLVIWYCGDAG